MNTAWWVIQGLAALGFLAAGGFKLTRPKAELDKVMTWAKGFSPGQVKLIASAELLGAIGLVAPQATGLLPWLTPVAGAALALLMLGAVATHLRIKDPPAQAAPAAINLLLAAAVAVGRSGLLG